MSPNNLALFIFLATLAVAVFAFLSVAVWVGTQHQDRKSRDRFALLKTLAEQPGENAKHVLDMLREQEARQAAQRESQERRGFLVGGLTVVATGIGLSVMLATLSAKPGTWTVGLMLMLIGGVLSSFGLLRGPGGWSGGGGKRSDL